jgi:hypothetical protein
MVYVMQSFAAMIAAKLPLVKPDGSSIFEFAAIIEA